MDNWRNYLSKLFLLLFILISFSDLHAQWKLSLKNKHEKPFNSFLFLEYQASTNSEKHFKVEVRFRKKDTHSTFLKKEFLLTTNKSKVFSVGLNLYEGDYEVDVFIHDKDIQSYTSLTLDKAFSVNSDKPIKVSDIYLSYKNDLSKVFSNPIMDRIIDKERKRLYYFMEVDPSDYEALTIRAVLYKKVVKNRASRTEAYSSLNQTNKILALDSGSSIVFRDSLVLDNLVEGEYLLDVRIYDDNLPLKVEDIRFDIGGGIKRKIFEDLDYSIQMMEYTMPIKALNEVLRLPDEAGVKENEFIELWKKLHGDDYEEEMEDYYRKIYISNERYNEGIEGWQTARGKTFIQYGEPKIKNLTINGKEYQKWIYGKWSLVFLFEKRNKRYLLVE